MFVKRRNFGTFFNSFLLHSYSAPQVICTLPIEWTFTCIQCEWGQTTFQNYPFNFFHYLDPNLSNSLLFDRQWDPLAGFWISILGEIRKLRQRNNTIDKHSNSLIVIKELIPLIRNWMDLLFQKIVWGNRFQKFCLPCQKLLPMTILTHFFYQGLVPD